ncbi:MAG: hypothetical protein KC776_43700 [Myxococcales bacterium]|nr:hypothetical protein [Myxococcales bacterium]MCB9575626.1 hypothetical protein [Polyangiaceae bacterium]
MSAGCDPTPADDPPSDVQPTGTPLPQDSVIPVEVWSNGEWMKIHPSQAGMERLAQQWCLYQRTFVEDDKLCGLANTTGSTQQTGIADLPPASTPMALCTVGLCVQRNEVCAGYMLEELGRSPLQRELDGASFDALRRNTPFASFEFDLGSEGLEIPKAELDEYSTANGGSSSARRVRFQPLAAPGRAAAFRGALNRFGAAGWWAEQIRTYGLENGATCSDTFQLEDLAIANGVGGNPPPLDPYADGKKVKWSDIYVTSFIDALNEYSSVLPKTVASMQDSAALELNGVAAPQDQTATQWNGKVDSVTAALKLLTYGPEDPPVMQAMAATPCEPETHPATEVGPTGVPVCPPISLNAGVGRAKSTVGHLKLPPKKQGSEPFADTVFRAWKEDEAALGRPVPAGYAKSSFFSKLGFTENDLETARGYLCQEAKAFGRFYKPDPSTGQNGTTQRAFTRGGPVVSLGAGVLKAQFAGALHVAPDLNIESAAYARSGAMNQLDQMRHTAGALRNGATSAYSPMVFTALGGMVEALTKQLGGRRLEFLIGTASLTGDGTVNKVRVLVHGVPQSGETYWVVQSLEGLKCVLEGSIDGAPCTTDDYRHVITAAVGSLDSRMTDLDPSSGTLQDDLTTLPKPGNPTAPITNLDPIYVIRVLDKAKPAAFGGVIPTPVTNSSIGDGFSRRVIVPAGGTLDEIVQAVGAPSTTDCSQTSTSCAGLKRNLWPPLESEITADPSAFSFERSWQRYLDLAAAASLEADQIGKDLLESGLRLDIRREEATRALTDLCGADANGETGCGDGAADMVEWVTLGQKQACMWQVDSKICGCPIDLSPGQECPAELTNCPFLLASDDTLDRNDPVVARGQCKTKIDNLITSLGYTEKPGLEAIAVVEGVGISNIDDGPGTASCAPLVALRKDTVTGNRSEYIRANILKDFGLEEMTAVADQLHYEEGFGDNYKLTYAGATVFDTNRPERPSLNTDAHAPCMIKKDVDEVSGSEFWSQQVDCFVSGKTCPPTEKGVGWDGCPNEWQTGSNLFTLDTEPAALRARWAWGFGHLRRSVATLGVLTGKIGKMMAVSELIPAARLNPAQDIDGNERLKFGQCKLPELAMREPNWVQHCATGNNFSRLRCVEVGKIGGVQGNPQNGNQDDAHRDGAGRPVNANGWLPNRPADAFGYPTYGPDEDGPFGTFEYPAALFPCASDGSGCVPNNGVDPQMVYCGLPEKDALAAAASNPDPYSLWTNGGLPYRIEGGAPTGYASAYVGDSFTAEVQLATNQTFKNAVDGLWAPPPFGDFCSSPDNVSVVWRALCSAPAVADKPLPALQADDGFMRFGSFSKLGGPYDPVYVNGQTIATWFAYPKNGQFDAHAALMLFDLRKKQNYPFPAFQYALTQRNIYDALELACHARTKGIGGVDCGSIDTSVDYRKHLGQAAAIVRCRADSLRRLTERSVVGPVPRMLLTSFATGQGLPSGSGAGGQFLSAANAEYTALSTMRDDVNHIADGFDQVALTFELIKQLEAKGTATVDQLQAEQVATMLGNAAAIASDVAGMFSSIDLKSGAVGAIAAHGAAALLTSEKMLVDWEAFDSAIVAAKAQTQADLIGATKQGLTELTHARDAANDLPVQVSNLATAASNLRVIQKQADYYRAQVDSADFLGDDKSDPQFVNIVERRLYAINLVRYEAALRRARKLAFIARRAIELRFGVDMDRMTQDMTLVPAPSTWSNDVCTMEGIDYDKLRQPDPEAVVEKFAFGAPPPSDTEFASQYIGDYVTKLQDFVTSYPFDYPLKEGDDVAVLSLADDILGVRSSCEEPSKNRLFFSTEFEKRDTEQVETNTQGWFIGGCGLGIADPTTQTTTEWRGCVTASEAVDDAVTVPLSGLPTDSVRYRIGNRPCVPSPNAQTPDCPDVSDYSAAGSLQQRLEGLSDGYYVASVYTHLDLQAAPYDSTNAAEMRVVRESDDAIVAATDVTVAGQSGWQRYELGFIVDPGDSYRIEIAPSKVGIALSGATPADWPGLLLSAAQVEKVVPVGSGGVPAATGWQRTGLSRTTVDLACQKEAGPKLRKLFHRHCDYVCSDGISQSCTGIDSTSTPIKCFYEATFPIALENIENGSLIPSGQIAIGNFNYRHNRVGLNIVGTGTTSCDNVSATSCYANGFLEYSLVHNGTTGIRNWEGATLPVTLSTAFIEHGKALAAEKTITNPPSSSDMSLLEPYMKGEYEGRPLHGLYTIRIWDRPELRWDRIQDIQLVLNYHYWTRFQNPI